MPRFQPSHTAHARKTASMEIRDTPISCAIGDVVLASHTPGFDHHRRMVRFCPKTQIAKGPTKEIWIFVGANYRNANGELESVWVREK